MRYVVLILLAVIAVWLVRRALRSSGKNEGAERPAVQGDLVSCARCGMHLPRAEAKEAGGALFCSDEHAKLGPSRG
jgi:uncharacterized protein